MPVWSAVHGAMYLFTEEDKFPDPGHQILWDCGNMEAPADIPQGEQRRLTFSRLLDRDRRLDDYMALARSAKLLRFVVHEARGHRLVFTYQVSDPQFDITETKSDQVALTTTFVVHSVTVEQGCDGEEEKKA